MSREINPFEDNPFLEIARIIHENSYEREKKEIEFENLKFDLIKRGKEKIIIGEIKKSSRFLKSAKMQLLFYLWRLKNKGLNFTGEILIPKEKKKIVVELREENERELKEAMREIKRIVSLEIPPKAEKNKYCSKCAYFEFCWA